MPRPKAPHLKRRSDGRYACRYQDMWFYGNTENEALRAREDYKNAQMELGPRPPTLNEFAERWLPLRTEGNSHATVAAITHMLRKFLKHIGNRFAHEVTPLDIREAYVLEFHGMSAPYIQHAKHTIISFFDACVSQGYCAKNPALDRTARPPRGYVHSHRAITPQEREWIETYCTDHRAWPVVMTMLYAGLRPQEAKALDISRSVDFSSKQLPVEQFIHLSDNNHYSVSSTGKTPKATRTIPLLPKLEAALKGRTGPVVASASGTPITITGWRTLWRSYVLHMEAAINGITRRRYQNQKARDPNIRPWISFTVVPYDLRHSFCTMCRDAGVEINTCIKWMGHSDATMILSVYDEVTHTREESEVEKLTKISIS